MFVFKQITYFPIIKLSVSLFRLIGVCKSVHTHTTSVSQWGFSGVFFGFDSTENSTRGSKISDTSDFLLRLVRFFAASRGNSCCWKECSPMISDKPSRRDD